MYTDSQYAYAVCHIHGNIWKQRGFLRADGTPVMQWSSHHSHLKKMGELLYLLYVKADTYDYALTTDSTIANVPGKHWVGLPLPTDCQEKEWWHYSTRSGVGVCNPKKYNHHDRCGVAGEEQQRHLVSGHKWGQCYHHENVWIQPSKPERWGRKRIMSHRGLHHEQESWLAQPRLQDERAIDDVGRLNFQSEPQAFYHISWPKAYVLCPGFSQQPGSHQHHGWRTKCNLVNVTARLQAWLKLLSTPGLPAIVWWSFVFNTVVWDQML